MQRDSTNCDTSRDELEADIKKAIDKIAMGSVKKMADDINNGGTLYDPEGLPYFSAYYMWRSTQRQERLMQDMHKQSKMIIRLTWAIVSMTAAVIILSFCQVLMMIMRVNL